MRRLLAASLLLAALFSAALLRAAPALAASAYDDVPLDHWSYGALDCLVCRGVLNGYSADVFDGQLVLTRFEFAQAIAHLLDDPNWPHACPCDVAEVARLQEEYAADLEYVSCVIEEWPDGGRVVCKP